MGEKARLAWLVVVRDDNERGVRADVGCGADHLDSCRRGIASAASDHRNPAPRHPDSLRDRLAMLIAAQGGALARRAARHEPVAALGDLPLDELGECVLRDTA